MVRNQVGPATGSSSQLPTDPEAKPLLKEKKSGDDSLKSQRPPPADFGTPKPQRPVFTRSRATPAQGAKHSKSVSDKKTGTPASVLKGSVTRIGIPARSSAVKRQTKPAEATKKETEDAPPGSKEPVEVDQPLGDQEATQLPSGEESAQAEVAHVQSRSLLNTMGRLLVNWLLLGGLFFITYALYLHILTNRLEFQTTSDFQLAAKNAASDLQVRGELAYGQALEYGRMAMERYREWRA